MSVASWGCRVVLAAVLLVAAQAKGFRSAQTTEAAVYLGLPARAAQLAGRFLVPAELVTAVALLIPPFRLVGSIAATILLGMFTGVLGSNLINGRRPVCQCFGDRSDKPIGPLNLVRNGALLACAFLAAWPFSALVGVGLAISTLAAVSIGACLPHLASFMLERTVVLNRAATRFRLRSTGGDSVSLADLLNRGRPVLLLFTDASCGPCKRILAEAAGWQRSLGPLLSTAIIGRGAPQAIADLVQEYAVDEVLLDSGATVAARFGGLATPSAILIGADGLIASSIAEGAPEIRTLLGRVAGSLPPAPLQIGDLLPDLDLRDAAGDAVFVSRAQPTLFVSTTATHARSMLGLLEAHVAPGQLAAIVLVPANVDWSDDAGVSVVLDPDGRNGAALGLWADLSAVLIDADLVVASAVARDEASILRLAERSAAAAAVATRLRATTPVRLSARTEPGDLT